MLFITVRLDLTTENTHVFCSITVATV